MKDSTATEQDFDHTLTYIGELVQNLRQERGITQKELATRLKTTQSAVARIEKGEQNLSALTLSRINNALKANLVNLSSGSINLRIEGGRKLKGEITTNSSKNGAVGLLCASLLNRGKTTLHQVPRIEEVFRIIEVLESIGVTVVWRGSSVTITPPEQFDLSSIDRQAASKTRSIIMFIGPLIHRLNPFALPKVGGCRLGSRSIKPHIYGLEEMGVKIEDRSHDLQISGSQISPAEVIMYEASDTATENLLMAAAGISGKTVIKFATANYFVQDLCFYLEKLGVEIDGIGTSTLTIKGRDNIAQDIEYTISEDPIDAMFFLTSAITTRSTLTIRRCPIDFLELELLKLEKMGLKYERSTSYTSHNQRTVLVDLHIKPSRLKALDEKIEPRPYPGLNIDNLPFFAAIATQTKGQTFIHDWVYEERAIYFKELDKLGAQTLLADPHRIYINGPTKLQANEIICPPALRPAAIILIAMLAAKGTSVLRNIYSINRGYEDIAARLRSVGAEIAIFSDL